MTMAHVLLPLELQILSHELVTYHWHHQAVPDRQLSQQSEDRALGSRPLFACVVCAGRWESAFVFDTQAQDELARPICARALHASALCTASAEQRDSILNHNERSVGVTA